MDYFIIFVLEMDYFIMLIIIGEMGYEFDTIYIIIIVMHSVSNTPITSQTWMMACFEVMN